MHSTVFIGEDVAGESLKELTKPDERVFLFTHPQGYGIARYAQRYMGWVESLNDFKDKETRFNIRYVCLYPAENLMIIKERLPRLYEYLEKEYRVAEIGLIEEPTHVFYVILEKGKGAIIEDFLKDAKGTIRLRTIYKVAGKLVFFYSLKPAQDKV